MKRGTVLAGVCVLVTAAVTGACGTTGAGASDTGQRQVILRLALNQTETHPSYVALENFGARLGQATGGQYTIDIFPNEVLGAQQEILSLMSNGIVDLAIISGTQLENINRDFQVFNLPRVFDSVEHQTKVINDPAITGELFTSLEEGNNLTVLGGFTQGTRNLYTKTAVQTPNDLRGKKIRVQESPVMLRMIDTLGASATPMAYGEVYTAMQAGVLDGAENNEVSYFTQRHYEVAPYYTYTKHLVGLDYMVSNTGVLNEMSPQHRAAFDAEWANTWKEFNVLWEQATQEAIDDATTGGARFVVIDTAPFNAKLEPLAESFLANDRQKALYAKTRTAAVTP